MLDGTLAMMMIVSLMWKKRTIEKTILLVTITCNSRWTYWVTTRTRRLSFWAIISMDLLTTKAAPNYMVWAIISMDWAAPNYLGSSSPVGSIHYMVAATHESYVYTPCMDDLLPDRKKNGEHYELEESDGTNSPKMKI